MKERRSFFDQFNSEFEKLLPSTKSYQSAFDEASNSFRERVGNSPYNSWESFKSVRSRKSRQSR
jgi:hypothetical protein